MGPGKLAQKLVTLCDPYKQRSQVKEKHGITEISNSIKAWNNRDLH
jgi:hypothetical protein